METSNTWNGSWFDQSNVDMAFFIRCSDTANSLKNITCIGLWGLSIFRGVEPIFGNSVFRIVSIGAIFSWAK
jgi:hypothetical protein